MVTRALYVALANAEGAMLLLGEPNEEVAPASAICALAGLSVLQRHPSIQ
jgi:hypothetical protein